MRPLPSTYNSPIIYSMQIPTYAIKERCHIAATYMCRSFSDKEIFPGFNFLETLSFSPDPRLSYARLGFVHIFGSRLYY